MLKAITFVVLLLCTVFFQFDSKCESTVDVGVFFYLWYDPAEHISWGYPKVCDYPVLGHYNSCDPFVVSQQLEWISCLQIDFIILCWYGYTSFPFIDNATHQIFEVAQQNSVDVKLCIMVEPYNETEGGYNYTEIYSYVHSEFVEPYQELYYFYEGKPLLLFYQSRHFVADGNITNSEAYTVLTVGHEEWCDWVYGYAEGLTVYGPYPRNQQFSIMPRYDETRIQNRCRQHCIDPMLVYLYQEQWEEAIKLANQGAIDVITITSWNEYPERTAIEPHYDLTAVNKEPFYLYNLTRKYISQLKGLPVSDGYLHWYQDPTIYRVPVIIVVVFAIFAVVWKLCRYLPVSGLFVT